MSWKKMPETIPEECIIEEYRADVVVVGLGYAGSAALRAAQEAGASSVGIEMQARSRYTLFGRDVGHINSEFTRSRGIPPVEPMALFEEWMRRAGNRADAELVRQFCEKSGEAFDWYTDMYGLEGLEAVHIAFWPEGADQFKKALETGDNSINGYRFWYGTAEFPDPMGWPGSPTLPDCAMANLKKAENAGARLFFETEAVQLVKEDDRIVGVIARDAEGHFCRFLAGRGVILAAGDFSGDPEMLCDLCPDVADLLPPGQKPRGMGRRGHGIRMGVWAGGRLETRPIPTMGGNSIVVMGMCNFASVWFDESGKRFCNENFGGTEFAGFAGNQRGIREILVVFDEHALENELRWAVPAHGGFDENVEGVADNLRALAEYAHAGGEQPYTARLKMPLGMQRAFYGRNAEELCANAGLDPAVAETLCREIRHYNEMSEKGADTDFGRDAKTLDPLNGMLFLQRVKMDRPPMTMVTVGGLLTDGKQRVLDERYQPIQGLYATGNCCGRRFGSQYSTPISGVSIGMAITLGREAGMMAASRKGKTSEEENQ